MGKLDEFLEKHMSKELGGVYGDNLRGILDELLKFKEFENVKKINVLDMPVYKASINTGKPIHLDEDYVGGDTVVNVHSMKMYTDEVNSLNDEIDLFGFELTPMIYNHDDIDKARKTHGVWRIPTLYDPKSFEPMCSIVVNWSPEAIQTTPDKNKEDEAKLKKRLIRLFTEALESGKPNIPTDKAVIIRCSPRSIINVD